MELDSRFIFALIRTRVNILTESVLRLIQDKDVADLGAFANSAVEETLQWRFLDVRWRALLGF
jgi:hypothetical protein